MIRHQLSPRKRFIWFTGKEEKLNNNEKGDRDETTGSSSCSSFNTFLSLESDGGHSSPVNRTRKVPHVQLNASPSLPMFRKPMIKSRMSPTKTESSSKSPAKSTPTNAVKDPVEVARAPLAPQLDGTPAPSAPRAEPPKLHKARSAHLTSSLPPSNAAHQAYHFPRRRSLDCKENQMNHGMAMVQMVDQYKQILRDMNDSSHRDETDDEREQDDSETQDCSEAQDKLEEVREVKAASPKRQLPTRSLQRCMSFRPRYGFEASSHHNNRLLDFDDDDSGDDDSCWGEDEFEL